MEKCFRFLCEGKGVPEIRGELLLIGSVPRTMLGLRYTFLLLLQQF